jgi:hypothetical protein
MNSRNILIVYNKLEQWSQRKHKSNMTSITRAVPNNYCRWYIHSVHLVVVSLNTLSCRRWTTNPSKSLLRCVIYLPNLYKTLTNRRNRSSISPSIFLIDRIYFFSTFLPDDGCFVWRSVNCFLQLRPSRDQINKDEICKPKDSKCWSLTRS